MKGHYDEKELNETYIGNVKRYDLIYKYYMKYRSKRALGFCCFRQHAEEMEKEFCKRGIASVAVYSNADGEFSCNLRIYIANIFSEIYLGRKIYFAKYILLTLRIIWNILSVERWIT